MRWDHYRQGACWIMENRRMGIKPTRPIVLSVHLISNAGHFTSHETMRNLTPATLNKWTFQRALKSTTRNFFDPTKATFKPPKTTNSWQFRRSWWSISIASKTFRFGKWIMKNNANDFIRPTLNLLVVLLWPVEVEGRRTAIEGVRGVRVGQQLGQEWLKNVRKICNDATVSRFIPSHRTNSCNSSCKGFWDLARDVLKYLRQHFVDRSNNNYGLKISTSLLWTCSQLINLHLIGLKSYKIPSIYFFFNNNNIGFCKVCQQILTIKSSPCLINNIQANSSRTESKSVR